MSILQLLGLTKQFGKLVAVNEIDLSIEEGEIRGLIGPNGSGKTTLFNVVTGFLRPTKGRVIWQGEDITNKSPDTIAKKGLVRTFQLTALFQEMTALKNVTIAFHLYTRTRLLGQLFGTAETLERESAIQEEAKHLLDIVGIGEMKDEIAYELPHGCQRALGIAIALASKPKMLLLDEPVTGMNPIETAEMMGRIKGLRDSGITILLVEHDMSAVMTTCEKITVMNFGLKIAEGTPKEVRMNKQVIEAYLGRE